MRGTTYWLSLQIGLESLRIHPLRTVLSTSGVIIGVLAFVATFAVTDGVDRWSRELIERESSVQDIVLTTRRTIDIDGRTERVRTAPVFTLDDWRSARASVPNTTTAILTVTGPSSVAQDGRRRIMQLTASTANLAMFTDIDLLVGRFFSDVEVSRDAEVIVLGHRLADELASPHDPLWLVGRTVRVGASRREVVGILAPRPGETDLVAFAPIGRRVVSADFGSEALTPTMRFKAASVELVPQARDAVVDWLAQRFPTQREALDVSVGLDRLVRAQQGILVTKLVFGFLTALMLAIGGIGIMNVLLASVAERTREIGVRKALGARGRDVLLHFLAESVAIASVGGVVGTILGAVLAVGAAAAFRTITGAPIVPVFTLATMTSTMVSALMVGVIFGTYPARVAARLTPIEAIQRE